MLTNSLPTIGDDRARHGLPGRPPSLWEPTQGCRFAPRCPFAQERCRAEAPPGITEGDHMVACWRAGEAPALRDAAARPATWAAVVAE